MLTPERRLSALRSIQTGALYDLSHEISPRAPFLLPNQTPFLQSIWASWRDSIRRRRAAGATNDAGSNVERVEMTMHVGTHIDALGHFSIGGKLYNGLNANDVVTDWGLERLGIEHMPPMISRGVLLDVSGLDGGAFLEPGRVLAPDDLERAADASGVAIQAGDIVLIRTGWGRFFGADNARYLQGEPGIDVPAAMMRHCVQLAQKARAASLPTLSAPPLPAVDLPPASHKVRVRIDETRPGALKQK